MTLEREASVGMFCYIGCAALVRPTHDTTHDSRPRTRPISSFPSSSLHPPPATMPPRGNEGYDFTPILTHYLFLFTSILAVVCLTLAPAPMFNLLTKLPCVHRQAGSLLSSVKPSQQQTVCSILFLVALLDSS